MNRNYTRPFVDPGWSDKRETHPAVAIAIHAIADSNRTADDIWHNPTSAEFSHVTMAVQEYLSHGDFAPTDDGRYQWGLEFISLPRESSETNQCQTAN